MEQHNRAVQAWNAAWCSNCHPRNTANGRRQTCTDSHIPTRPIMTDVYRPLTLPSTRPGTSMARLNLAVAIITMIAGRLHGVAGLFSNFRPKAMVNGKKPKSIVFRRAAAMDSCHMQGLFLIHQAICGEQRRPTL